MHRSWFPLALFGFSLLAMVGVSLGQASWFAYAPFNTAGSAVQFLTQNQQLGTGGVGGTAYSSSLTFVTQPRGWSPMVRWGPGIHAAGTAWLVVNIAVYLGVVIHRAVRDGLQRRRLVALLLGGPVVIILLDFTLFWELKLDADVQGPLLATAGLLLLAWLERSRIVLLAAVLFALVEVVLLGGTAGALLAAAILFTAAFAVLLRTRPEPPGDTA